MYMKPVHEIIYQVLRYARCIMHSEVRKKSTGLKRKGPENWFLFWKSYNVPVWHCIIWTNTIKRWWAFSCYFIEIHWLSPTNLNNTQIISSSLSLVLLDVLLRPFACVLMHYSLPFKGDIAPLCRRSINYIDDLSPSGEIIYMIYAS